MIFILKTSVLPNVTLYFRIPSGHLNVLRFAACKQHSKVSTGRYSSTVAVYPNIIIPPIRSGQKALIKWRNILETFIAVKLTRKKSEAKQSFSNRKRQKAKRLHRLKMQTEGHTQSGLVHNSGHHMMFKRLFSINTPGWLDHTGCIIWPRLHDFTSPDLLLLLASFPKCSLKTHGRPVFMFRVLFTHIPLINTIIEPWGQRFLSHEIHCGWRIRAPFLSCSWSMLPFMMLCNHNHAMKLKWARTSDYST